MIRYLIPLTLLLTLATFASPQSTTDEVMQVLAQSENIGYIGEAVSQLEHALQAAHLAKT